MNISWRLGRRIRWDGEKEQIIDDPEADALVTRKVRAPWSMEISRASTNRSGATTQPVVTDLRLTWSVRLPAAATQPVIAAGKVLLPPKGRQTLYALDADSGRTL